MELITSVGCILVAILLGVGSKVLYEASKYMTQKKKAIYDNNRSVKLKAIVESLQTSIQYVSSTELFDILEGEGTLEEKLKEARQHILDATFEKVDELTTSATKDYIEKHLSPEWGAWLESQVKLIFSTVEEQAVAADEAKQTRLTMMGNGQYPPMR